MIHQGAYQTTLYDLLKAYGDLQGRQDRPVYAIARRSVLALDEALERLSRMIGAALDWTEIGRFLPDSEDPDFRRSALASTFVAALELARLGRASLVQTEPFGALHLKALA